MKYSTCLYINFHQLFLCRNIFRKAVPLYVECLTLYCHAFFVRCFCCCCRCCFTGNLVEKTNVMLAPEYKAMSKRKINSRTNSSAKTIHIYKSNLPTRRIVTNCSLKTVTVCKMSTYFDYYLHKMEITYLCNGETF